MANKSIDKTDVDGGGAENEDGGPGFGTNPFVTEVLDAAARKRALRARDLVEVLEGASIDLMKVLEGAGINLGEVLDGVGINLGKVLDGAGKNLGKVLDGAGIDGVPAMVPRGLQHFLGFVQESEDGRTLRIYTSRALDEGVDVPDAEVLYRKRLKPSSEDGLARDCVVVPEIAECLYWSRRPPRSIREPGGGNGYPFPNDGPDGGG